MKKKSLKDYFYNAPHLAAALFFIIVSEMVAALCVLTLRTIRPDAIPQSLYLACAVITLIISLLFSVLFFLYTRNNRWISPINRVLRAAKPEKFSNERHIEKNEERFKVIFDYSQDGIIVAEADSRQYIMANPAVLRMFDYKLEDFLGMKIEQCHPQDFASEIIKSFKAMVRGEWDRATDIPCLRRDGSLFYADIHGGRAIFDEKVCNIAFFRDVSTRKAAQESLRESEKKFKFFTDQVSFDGMVIHEEGRYLEVSKPFAEMHGYTQEELLKRPAWVTIPPEEVERVKKVAQAQKEELYESVGMKKDGTRFPVEIRARNLPYKGGQVRAAAVRDISARKQVERKISEAVERYRSLFEKAGDAIFILGIESECVGKIVEANQAAADMHGYTREELMGMSIKDLDDPGTAEFAAARMQKMLDGKWLKIEGRHIRKDGTDFPVEISAGQIEFGGRKYILAFDRDVTERIQAEKDKRDLLFQLMQSQKMEAVGALSSGLAHDFNNILQAISGYVQLLNTKDDLSDKQREFLSQIEGAAERGSDLVQRLMAFSRKVEPHLKTVDINIQISQTVGLLERTLPKMVAIETDLKASPPFIKGDATQLEQVVLNIGSNAGDAMPDGGILYIATEFINFSQDSEALPAGDYIRISLRDTGHGIEPNTIKKIFDPFFTTKAVGRGTGLGLAMVYGIIKSHGGHIECKSRPGTGTEFIIHWPALQDPPSEDSGLEKAPADSQDKIGSETILVVDDEAAIRDITSEALEDQGYKVITAANGEEALDIFSSKKAEIDLVTLDLGMPGMGGFNCLKKLIELKSDIKVIVASGYSSEGDIEELSPMAGARGFIKKPFKLSVLVSLVRDILDQ